MIVFVDIVSFGFLLPMLSHFIHRPLPGPLPGPGPVCLSCISKSLDTILKGVEAGNKANSFHGTCIFYSVLAISQKKKKNNNNKVRLLYSFDVM